LYVDRSLIICTVKELNLTVRRETVENQQEWLILYKSW